MPIVPVLAQMLLYLLAEADDGWAAVIAAVLALCGGGLSVGIYKVVSWWDASAAKQLLLVRRELAECKADKEQADADLKDEKSDRAASKERHRIESERRAVEVDELRELVSSLRAQLAEAYKTIADRDHTVSDNSRRIDRANSTLTVLSAMVLELLGDARSRKS